MGGQEEQKQEQDFGLDLIPDFPKSEAVFVWFPLSWVVGLFKTGTRGKMVA